MFIYEGDVGSYRHLQASIFIVHFVSLDFVALLFLYREKERKERGRERVKEAQG